MILLPCARVEGFQARTEFPSFDKAGFATQCELVPIAGAVLGLLAGLKLPEPNHVIADCLFASVELLPGLLFREDEPGNDETYRQCSDGRMRSLFSGNLHVCSIYLTVS